MANKYKCWSIFSQHSKDYFPSIVKRWISNQFKTKMFIPAKNAFFKKSDLVAGQRLKRSFFQLVTNFLDEMSSKLIISLLLSLLFHIIIRIITSKELLPWYMYFLHLHYLHCTKERYWLNGDRGPILAVLQCKANPRQSQCKHLILHPRSKISLISKRTHGPRIRY